jgi:iron-sulfur cluster assembly protein
LFLTNKKIEKMIFVSEAAKTKINEIIQEEQHLPNTFVRVSVKGGGCSGLSYDISFDTQSTPDDQFFEDKGIRLCTDLRSFLYVCNSTLEFTDGLNGKGFHFTNPNAARTCACGESFSV